MEKAQGFITDMCHLQDELVKKAGKEKLPLAPLTVELANKDALVAEATPLLEKACFQDGKMTRGKAISAVKKQLVEAHAEQFADEIQKKLFDQCFDDIQYNLLRKSILDKGLRIDGRKCNEIRPITCEVNVLPRPHGSALFTRGKTQSLAVTTLGTVMDAQVYDDID